MHRDIPVIAYISEKGAMICRACLGYNSEEDICEYCNSIRDHDCAVKGNGELNKEMWDFDNTKHKILFTIDKCMAKERCNMVSSCPCQLSTHVQKTYKEKNNIV